MKALVIGYGSIGSRHASVLKSMGVETAVLSSRGIDFTPRFASAEEALDSFRPGYAVIANRTHEHLRTMQHLKALGFHGDVMVEKPLFSSPADFDGAAFRNIFVGYNLRFHPLLQKLKKSLAGEKILTAQAYVGRYLPFWRPETDYRASYSAFQQEGGGVLRDLSHEIDYLSWMLGPLEVAGAVGGHFSGLQIQSDDAYGLLMRAQRCPLVTLQMNYLDRVSRREIVLNTETHSYKADLVSGKLWTDDAAEDFQVERNATYRSEHEAVLSGKFENLCSWKEGVDVLRVIQDAETAASGAVR